MKILEHFATSLNSNKEEKTFLQIKIG